MRQNITLVAKVASRYPLRHSHMSDHGDAKNCPATSSQRKARFPSFAVRRHCKILIQQ